MMIQYLVRLTPEQRRTCQTVARDERVSLRAKRRALVLLYADSDGAAMHLTDEAVATAAGVDPRTVARVRTTYVKQGFEVALHGRPRSAKTPPKLTPQQEARLLAMTATPPPPGYPRWTVRTLAASLRQFADMPPVSRELVRRTLIRHNHVIHGSPILDRVEVGVGLLLVLVMSAPFF